MYINFQQNVVSRSVNSTCTQFYLQKNGKFRKFEFKKFTPFGHALPTADIQAIFEINRRILDFDLPRKNSFSRTTDGQTKLG